MRRLTKVAKRKGVVECEEALERLLQGNPHVAEHVGVEAADITAAMVSVEAGFDKGYLKKSRDAHKPLIARIGALSKENADKGDNDRRRLRKVIREAEELRAERERNQAIMDKVLTQNLMLLGRVRELEGALAKSQKVVRLGT